MGIESLFAKEKPKTFFDDFLTKRSYPFQNTVNYDTVAPQQVFQVIEGYTKFRKLCDSTDFLQFPDEKLKLNASTESIESHQSEDESENAEPSTHFSHPHEASYDSESDDDSSFEEQIDTKEPLQTTRAPVLTKDGSVNVHAEVAFYKRENGNQAWEQSCSTPPKLGKMRKITCSARSSSETPHPVQFQFRTIDKHPGTHCSKLVLCRGDRCCVKVKQDGKKKKKPIVECVDRLNVLTIPQQMVDDKSPCFTDVYLKPEWNGLGENKSRPSFEVVVELIDCSDKTVHEISRWDVELQSHKFESSTKAKEMEQTATSVEVDLSLLSRTLAI